MKTGIFFHYQQGQRLRDFPDALDGILNRDNLIYYDAHYPEKPASSYDLEPISLRTLCDVHSTDMVERVKKTGDYEGAVYSAAGTISAALRIWSGEITNAFVFTGYGDHHAGGDFFGGGCYFNGAAIAVRALRRRYRVSRLSIIDTDAHHGDGTWDLFENDPDLLYLCFCTGQFQEKNRNVNIQVPFHTSDDDYFEMVKGALVSRIADFRPALIFWNWGYDGTTGDYGDLGLTPKLHLRLATEIKKWAHEVCGGRLIIVLCGGSRRDLASFLIPRMIEILLDPV